MVIINIVLIIKSIITLPHLNYRWIHLQGIEPIDFLVLFNFYINSYWCCSVTIFMLILFDYYLIDLRSFVSLHVLFCWDFNFIHCIVLIFIGYFTLLTVWMWLLHLYVSFLCSRLFSNFSFHNYWYQYFGFYVSLLLYLCLSCFVLPVVL